MEPPTQILKALEEITKLLTAIHIELVNQRMGTYIPADTTDAPVIPTDGPWGPPMKWHYSPDVPQYPHPDFPNLNPYCGGGIYAGPCIVNAYENNK